MKYINIPHVVEAFQFGVDEEPDWFTCHVYYVPIPGQPHRLECVIPSLEGTLKAHKGDFIIKGISGEIYPCKEDIFMATYKPLEEAEK